jgi:CRP/FNR family transcriptional regulator, polysaccharide utilization system transcription regulator
MVYSPHNHNSISSAELLKMPGFGYLKDLDISLLLEHSNVVQYKKNDVIFKQNTRTSHIMFILSGMVKVYKEARNDRSITLTIATEGNLIGSMSVFGGEIHEYSASSVENSDIVFIDITVFKKILHENGVFAESLLKVISRDGLFIFEKLLNHSHKQLPGRIADVLLFFSQVIYKHHVFSFPLSRRELAEIAGTTKESFIRTLTEFRNDKIISIEGKRIEILSMDIVKTLSRLG